MTADSPPVRGLIACDLDGTMLRSDGTVSPRTVAAIRRVEEAGWAFVMVTGRPVRRVLPVAEAAGITGLALCSNGAIVVDVESRTMIDGHPIDPVTACTIISDLRAAIGGVMFAFELGLRFGREESYPRRIVAAHAESPADELIGDALVLAGEPVHKLIAAHAERDFDRFLSEVRDAAADRVEVTHSAREFVEISARGIDKASGVRLHAERLSLDAQDVVAIGDMPNDMPMLAYVGRSFAVANAHPDVLRSAQRVVASNDDDGVADVLDSLL
jgi:Cof subfamily protein (haloacid dehalogenase superfamily)